MDLSTTIGSGGVGLLLLAYFMQVFGWLKQKSLTYVLLNLFGSALSCYASMLIHYMPFVVLEALWCIVALISLLRLISNKYGVSPSTGH
ncbi:MAG: hypothetical protein K2X81_06625 [Candidatus Obscuribacterales bacterium]|nr:hypothetical protein [Candidatus Obscuribacterales bacterium]